MTSAAATATGERFNSMIQPFEIADAMRKRMMNGCNFTVTTTKEVG
jgi:hypothetical protein